MSGSVLVVAGEISGDLHAAALARALHAHDSQVTFIGVGGEALRSTGAELLFDTREMAVMGLWEVLRRARFFRGALDDLVELVRAQKPDIVLLVDYPGFNLRLARRARALGVRVVYYICPQVWAWHRSRIGQMARIVNRLLTIFPFEPAVFEGTGLRATFVGHPLVDVAQAAMQEPLRDLPWKGGRRVALLPGSRQQEIRRILPVLWRAAAHVERRAPEASFLLAAPTEDVAALVRSELARLPSGPSRWDMVAGETRQVLRQAHAALVASGTATVEAALMNCPMVVVYRTGPLLYALGRHLIRVPFIGMVNLIADRMVCPEHIQGKATPARLAASLLPLLSETPERAAQLEGLSDVRKALGPPGASGRAAEIVLEEIRTAQAVRVTT